MPRTKPPEMKVSHGIAIGLDTAANALLERGIRRDIHQHLGGISHERVSPRRNHTRAHEPHDGIHPDPAENLRCEKPEDRKERHGRIADDVHEGGAEVMVTMGRIVMGIKWLRELDLLAMRCLVMTDGDNGAELMRLGDVVHRLYV